MDADEIQASLESDARPPVADARASAASSGPTLRERWRRVMYYQSVDRIPNFEFGYWHETLAEWRGQGLPPEIDDERKAYGYFGIENWQSAPVNTMGLMPRFAEQVISEDDEYTVYRDKDGATARINRRGHKSIPHYIDFLLKDRAAWESEFKPRLRQGAARLPDTWPALVESYRRRAAPLAVNRGSMIGVLRNWIGFEGIALMVYDDPELLEEMVEHLCQLVCATLETACRDVEFDFAYGWEDICFNSGPIVGVNFMRDVVRPRYRRISDVLARHGCGISWTDCDGNILPVLDVFVEGGLNACFPVEVNGGSDPVEIRRRHPWQRLQGGFCKMRLREGPEAIRRELERLLPLVRAGGFLPGVDHRVQADAPLANYKYYLKLKREMFGVGGVPQYDEKGI